MLDHFLYYAKTIALSGFAIFGISGVLEQPHYRVVANLGDHLEIRAYDPAAAAEATTTAATRNAAAEAAFRLLFHYITGDNAGDATIAMTAPVQQSMIPMTAPVSTEAHSEGGKTEVTMRFFLPAAYRDHPPAPRDPRVKLAAIPAMTVAALRFSGNPTPEARREKTSELLRRLAATSWTPHGEPWLLGYDPPFAVPFLKRNEVLVEVSAGSR